MTKKTKINNRVVPIFHIFVFVLFVASFVYAGGIQTPTADIVVTNLRIGETYNLTEIANMPFQVRSLGMERRLKIELVKPTTNQVVAGYEPIPDVTWVTLPRTDFLLLPGETGMTDIIIKIPDDESLLGRKFEAKIWARTVPKDPTAPGSIGFGLGVMGSLRFSIAPKPPTPEEIERFRRAKFRIHNISLLPNDLVLERPIPIGRRVNVERLTGKFLRLTNVDEEPVRIRLRCVPVSETGLTLPEGWEAEPSTKYLKFPQEVITVRGLEIRKINFFLHFPRDEKYANRRYMFIVEAAIEGELVRTTYRSKIYVETEK